MTIGFNSSNVTTQRVSDWIPKKEVLVHVIAVNYKLGACPWIDSTISAERMTNGRCYLTPRLFDRERENKIRTTSSLATPFPRLQTIDFQFVCDSVTAWTQSLTSPRWCRSYFIFHLKKKNCLWSQPRDLILPDDSDESAQREKQFQDTSRCDRSRFSIFLFLRNRSKRRKKNQIHTITTITQPQIVVLSCHDNFRVYFWRLWFLNVYWKSFSLVTEIKVFFLWKGQCRIIDRGSWITRLCSNIPIGYSQRPCE